MRVFVVVVCLFVFPSVLNIGLSVSVRQCVRV